MNSSSVSKQTIQLKPGQSAMFGYGSLLFPFSMELTLGKPYSEQPISCSVAGWRRTWDVVMPNQNFFEQGPGGEWFPGHIIYLNLTPDEGKSVNGLLYILEPEELKLFDKREWIYNRVPITNAIETHEVHGGEAYAYVAGIVPWAETNS